MDKDTALKLALDCLEDIFGKEKIDVGAINALRQAIAEAEKQEPVACPFPCGWKRLFEIIVADGAFLARSLEEGEAITEHQREVVMHMIGYAKDMALHGMKATPPEEALAQPEQEPVAMRYDFDGYGWLYIDNGSGSNWREKIKNAEPLYTAPPKREWVGLDDEDMKELRDANFDLLYGARWAEQKLRKKNGG